MAQSAYDFARFEKKPERKPELRAVNGGRKRPSRLMRARNTLRKVLAVAVFLVAACCVLGSKATVNELTNQIQRAKKELVTVQSTGDHLNNELNKRTNLAKVEEVAGRLGLMRLDDSQITYIRLDESSVVSHTESGFIKLGQDLYAGLLSLFQQLAY